MKIVDKEILAIRKIERAIANLTEGEKRRVLVFVAERNQEKQLKEKENAGN